MQMAGRKGRPLDFDFLFGPARTLLASFPSTGRAWSVIDNIRPMGGSLSLLQNLSC